MPARRDSHFSAWVAISVGCNNTCTFCIVPSLRGKEKDRRPGDILAEIETLVAQGVVEITLLGQNVNAYGVEFGEPGAFASLLRATGEIAGLERVRFTSPHPRDFTDDVIDAMAQTPNVMPQLHMPLQSGSDRILQAMRRSYRRDRYLGIIEKVRAAMPHAAITTDIIVGFPGETEADFQRTMEVAAEACFDSAYEFEFSPRPGTEAAGMEDRFVDPKVVNERFERLRVVLEHSAEIKHQERVGRVEEVIVEGVSKRNEGVMTGRTRQNKLVHFPSPEPIRVGSYANVLVTSAARHFLRGELQKVTAPPTHKVRLSVSAL